MTVAILADSHDNLPALRYFVDYFRSREVDWLIHAGDLISPFMVPELSRLDRPVELVFGNNDGDHQTLTEKARDTQIRLHSAPCTIEKDGFTYLISHRPEDLPDSIPDAVDFVIHGHTHQEKIERNDSHVLINPGEAGGWLNGISRAVSLEPETQTIDEEMVPRP